MFENLLVDSQDGLSTITLNRPKALNALNSATLLELERAIAGLPEATRVVILTGAGEKAFVAGADIAEMRGMSVEQATTFSQLGHAVFAHLEALPAVTIAAINGFALGGGLELAMSCDLLYASENARLGQPEVNLGAVPGFGGTQRLPRLVGPQLAREMLFTGDMIDAPTAKARGLVCDVLPREKLLEHVRGVAAKIMSKGPLAIAEVKRLIRDGAALELGRANALESRSFGELFGTLDNQEGMGAYLERRPAKFEGR